jgi:aldehyde dehydrogenase (NAD+)
LNSDPEKTGMFDTNRRVRAQKFRGEVSDGFWVPLSNFSFIKGSVLVDEGFEFDELNGTPICSKYINPATAKKIASVAKGNEKDIDAAVKSANKAFESWSKTAPKERAKYIYRIARMIQERAREFAVIETMNGGKSIRESRDIDVPLAANHFFYYAGWADKLEYAFPNRNPKPIGVAGQIIPWNFPLLMAAWKLAPALATGNTVVLKPAETTSITAMKFASLLTDAGLPPGVVNIVTGGPDAGRAITALAGAKNGIDKIAFTGSTEVGKAIAKDDAVVDEHDAREARKCV